MRSAKMWGLAACVLFGATALWATSVEAGCGPGGCGSSYGGGSYSFGGGCSSGSCYSGGCSSGSCALPAPSGQAYRAPRSSAPTYAYQSAPRSLNRAPRFQYAFGPTQQRSNVIRSTPSSRVLATSAPQR